MEMRLARHQTIALFQHRGVQHIRFLQPVLDLAMLDEISTALESLAFPGSLPLLLVSRHPSVFLAGANLAEIEQLDAARCIEYAGRGRRVARLISQHPAPTVAAVHGSCSGGGVDLVLSCDALISRPDATFQHPGIRRGLVTGWSGTARLPHGLGRSNVRRMLLEGASLNGRAMVDLGLVQSVSDEPGAEAIDTAISLAALDSERLRLWRALRKPGFIDRFRATVVHKLR